jgi:ACT domain-containing protein
MDTSAVIDDVNTIIDSLKLIDGVSHVKLVAIE